MPLGFDPHTPSVARLYDYYLGGKDHLPADRVAAEQLLKVAPGLRAAARANRAFLRRAVRHLAESGITQFLDIGTGLPAQGNVHEVAGRIEPGSAVVYVDHDPVVLVHARALLARQGNTVAVGGDLRKPEALLRDPEVTRALDFGRPMAVLLVAVMHYIAESDRPDEIIATLREAMAPGSYLVMSHATSDVHLGAAGDLLPEPDRAVATDGVLLESPGNIRSAATGNVRAFAAGSVRTVTAGSVRPGAAEDVRTVDAGDVRPVAIGSGIEVYQRAGIPLALRGRERIGELFRGFELVAPGLVWLPEWHPEPADVIDFVGDPQSSLLLCGVGRKG